MPVHFGQVRGRAADRGLEDRKHIVEERGLLVIVFDQVQERFRPAAGGVHAHVPDLDVGAGAEEGHGAEEFPAADQADPVAVHPALADVVQVVVQQELVGGGDQLEIAEVGEEIRLHGGKAHTGVSF